MFPRFEKRHWGAIALLTLAGLGVRVACARGGLWLDEAWSAFFAHQTGTPVGIFWNFAHDNNHPLNTLWLLFVGWGAPTLAQRALSIASGSAAIILAAWIARRWGEAASLCAAILFAFSPILVTYGSEARGYAPMMLGILFAIESSWCALESDEPRRFALRTALAIGLALLAQMTAIFALVALIGWGIIDRWYRDRSVAASLRWNIRLFGPSLITTILVLSAIFVPAFVHLGGYHIGHYAPFDLDDWIAGMTTLIGASIGIATHPPGWVLPLAILVSAAAIAVLPRVRIFAPFAALAIFAFPASIAILRFGNSDFSRYYLTAVLALLLLASALLGAAWDAGRLARAASVAAIIAFVIGSVRMDHMLFVNLRGDPAKAVTALARRAPEGANILIESGRSMAVLETAAASAGYPLTTQVAPAACPPPRFLFVERDGTQRFPQRQRACGIAYREIAGANATGLSGSHWRLYERRDAPQKGDHVSFLRR